MSERILLSGPAYCGKSFTVSNLMISGDIHLEGDGRQLSSVQLQPGAKLFYETNCGREHWSSKGKQYCTYFDTIYLWPRYSAPGTQPRIISRNKPEDREQWVSFWGIVAP